MNANLNTILDLLFIVFFSDEVSDETAIRCLKAVFPRLDAQRLCSIGRLLHKSGSMARNNFEKNLREKNITGARYCQQTLRDLMAKHLQGVIDEMRAANLKELEEHQAVINLLKMSPENMGQA